MSDKRSVRWWRVELTTLEQRANGPVLQDYSIGPKSTKRLQENVTSKNARGHHTTVQITFGRGGSWWGGGENNEHNLAKS